MIATAVWCILGLVSMTTASSRPHIIFILVDDLAWGDVSYHSDESSAAIRTPNIDALAEEGIKLENYYVQPMCSPSRSQLMSGRYQIHTGLMHYLIQCAQETCHPLEDRFLPGYLKDYNYITHGIGKWHLGMYKPACLPTNRGFDTHFGVLLGGSDYYSREKSCGVKKSENGTFTGKDFRFTHPGVDDDRIHEEYEGLYTTEVYVNRTKEIIAEYSGGTAASLPPLFLYLAFQSPHKPLEVPDRYLDIYEGSRLGRKRKTHAAMVSSLDHAVGEVVDALEDAGIYDDSVIIFSTDNGGPTATHSSNWPLRGAKFTMWEGGIRGVGFITSRNHIPECKAGSISRHLIHISDWLPTIIEGALGETIAASSDPNDELDGFNVWDYFTKCTVDEPIRNEVLINIDPYYKGIRDSDYITDEGVLRAPTEFHTSIHAGLRVGDMKILTGSQGRMTRKPPPESNLSSPVETLEEHQLVRLFNITADPYEQTDLSESEPTIVADMLSRLSAYWTSAKRAEIFYPRQVLEADPQLRDGYWGPWRNDDESLIVKSEESQLLVSSTGDDDRYSKYRNEKPKAELGDSRLQSNRIDRFSARLRKLWISKHRQTRDDTDTVAG